MFIFNKIHSVPFINGFVYAYHYDKLFTLTKRAENLCMFLITGIVSDTHGISTTYTAWTYFDMWLHVNPRSFFSSSVSLFIAFWYASSRVSLKGVSVSLSAYDNS